MSSIPWRIRGIAAAIAVDDLSSPNILVDAHVFDDFARGYVEWAGLEEDELSEGAK